MFALLCVALLVVCVYCVALWRSDISWVRRVSFSGGTCVPPLYPVMLGLHSMHLHALSRYLPNADYADDSTEGSTGSRNTYDELDDEDDDHLEL